MLRSWLGLGLLVGAAFLSACDDQGISRPPAIVDPGDGGSTSSGGEGGVPPGPEPRPNGIVRVATFNVHLFFDTKCDTGKCTASDFEKQNSPSTFASEVDRIAKAIEKLDADVIALEEIENDVCLDALVDKLTADGFGYPVKKLGESGPSGSVDVGIIARGDLVTVKTHKDTPIPRIAPESGNTYFTRELLEMHLKFGQNEMVVFAAHFRSQRDDDPGRRLAEATAARTIITAAAKAKPQAFVLLAGDLNDVPGSDTLKALESGGGLVRLLSDYPTDKQGTFTFQGKAEAIDHLYAGKEQAARYVGGTSIVVRDAAVGGLGGSDHAAVRADIKMN